MKRLCTVAAMLVVGSSNVFAASMMKPGLWQITTSMEMSGMPGMGTMKMPGTSIKHCYQSEEVSDTKKTLPQDNKNCKITDIKQSGSTVSWKMSCTGKEAMTGEGWITYGTDAYSGTMHAKMSGDMAMEMTQKYDAKRIGDCMK